MYHIAGNIGECFNLANWQFLKKPPNLNPFNPFVTTVDITKWRRIAKLKLAKCCQIFFSPIFPAIRYVIALNCLIFTCAHDGNEFCQSCLALILIFNTKLLFQALCHYGDSQMNKPLCSQGCYKLVTPDKFCILF